VTAPFDEIGVFLKENLMIRNVAVAAVLALLLAASCFAQQSADELAVWKLEHSYWESVKALDLPVLPRIVASQLCRLAVCESQAGPQRSHHRLDYGEHG
jgi:hypothetical protein